jgi:beta-lactamase class D
MLFIKLFNLIFTPVISRSILSLIALFCFVQAQAQKDLQKHFADCQLRGSFTLFDYKNNKWTYSDENEADIATVPASTFKIINTLIALEERVIKDENEVLKWDGIQREISPWNEDTDMKNAYKNSTVWFYQELARRIGKERYARYLEKCNYGNGQLTSAIDRFWLDGSLRISPRNQINFLKNLYEEKLPFSKRSYEIVKRIMVQQAPEVANYVLRAKTGWGKVEALDIGWWVGYVEKKDNVYFFATRVQKPVEITNEKFMECRKEITRNILAELNILP